MMYRNSDSTDEDDDGNVGDCKLKSKVKDKPKSVEEEISSSDAISKFYQIT